MKSLTSFIVVFVIAFCNACAQPPQAPKNDVFDIVWGKEYIFPKKHIDLGFLGSVSEGFVQMSIRYKKDLILQGFDSKMKMNKEVKVDIKKMPKSIVHEGFYKVGGKYYWLYSTWIRKEKKEQLYAQGIDISKAALSGKAIKLTESEKLAGTGYVQKGMYSFDVAGKYSISFAADSNMMMVNYRRTPADRDDGKNKDKIGFFVFDGDMKKVWGKEMKMPYVEAKMENVDYTVDNKGNAYQLSKIYKTKKKEAVKGKPNYDYEIMVYPAEGGDVKKIPVTITDKFINDILITEDLNGNIICAGLYSNEGGAWSSGSSDGVFITKVDTAGTFVNVHKGYYEFPTEILTQFMPEKKQKKVEKKEDDGKEIEAANLELRNVILNSDGSVLVGGENHYVTSHTYTSGGRTYTRYTYHFNDILLMKIGATGEMEWTRKIPKRQSSSCSQCDMSYKLYLSGSNVFLLYLDNLKNLKLKENEAPVGHGGGMGGVLVYSKIDETGEVTKDKILDVRDVKVRLWPTDFQDAGDRVLINRAIGKGKSKILLLTENE